MQVQDKFRLDLNDEQAVQYMQSLIDISVTATFAALVEQMHKFAQVSCCLKFSCCLITEKKTSVHVLHVAMSVFCSKTEADKNQW